MSGVEIAGLVAFLNEAAVYFERRDTNGEDSAFWSNVANAENCRKAAARLAQVDALDQQCQGFANLNAKLKADNKEMGYSFDVRWGASRRATERWQAANPSIDLTWPDHADLVVWCLDEVSALTRQRDEALAALKASEEALDERIDTAWADGARFVVNELDSLIPDSTLVRDKLVDIDQMIARRYADAIASRKERRARSALENGPSGLADATNNPPSDPGTEQRDDQL